MLKNFLRISVAAGVLLAAVLVSNAQSVNGSLGTVTKGKPQRATVYLSIPGGQHANSHNPNSEYAIATVVRASSTKGVKIGAVSYPRGRNRKFGFSENPINVYEGRVAFTFPPNGPPKFCREQRPRQRLRSLPDLHRRGLLSAEDKVVHAIGRRQVALFPPKDQNIRLPD
jgi:hypothetical protein